MLKPHLISTDSIYPNLSSFLSLIFYIFPRIMWKSVKSLIIDVQNSRKETKIKTIIISKDVNFDKNHEAASKSLLTLSHLHHFVGDALQGTR